MLYHVLFCAKHKTEFCTNVYWTVVCNRSVQEGIKQQRNLLVQTLITMLHGCDFLMQPRELYIKNLLTGSNCKPQLAATKYLSRASTYSFLPIKGQDRSGWSCLSCSRTQRCWKYLGCYSKPMADPGVGPNHPASFPLAKADSSEIFHHQLKQPLYSGACVAGVNSRAGQA